MKIIFLDIDGVLTTIKTKWMRFDPSCVKPLKRVIEDTGAHIVLSSSWRMGFADCRKNPPVFVPPEDVLTIMRELFTDAGLPADKLIDKTGKSKDNRGKEIDTWLKKHPEVSSFVILDDDNDMDSHISRLVLTNWGDGMNEQDADKAIKMLND